MGIVWGRDATFFTEMITQIIKTKPLPGANKTDTLKREMRYFGWLDGMSTGLAYYGNELRREKIDSLSPSEEDARWVQAMYPHEITGWMHDIISRWRDGEWKEKSDPEFFAEVYASFSELIFNENFMKSYTGIRRASIRAGRLEPGPEDVDWLEEEYKLHAETAAPLKELLERARG